jgi:hypothetical protein
MLVFDGTSVPLDDDGTLARTTGQGYLASGNDRTQAE